VLAFMLEEKPGDVLEELNEAVIKTAATQSPIY